MLEALWQWDRDAFRLIHEGWRSPFLDPLFLVLSTLGLGHIQGLVILAVCGNWGTWLKRGAANPLWPYFWPSILALASSGLFNQLTFKMFLARERPSNFEWAVPKERYYYDSFASGHTTTSFAVAFYALFVTWGTPAWRWGPALLIVATAIGISRIYQGVHWPTDVIGGGLIGLAFGALFAWAFHPATEASSETQAPQDSLPTSRSSS